MFQSGLAVAASSSIVDRADPLGLSLAAGAAAALGLAIALSRLAYDGGTNGLTVATSRGLFMVFALGLFCWLSGRSFALPAKDYLQCVGLGLLMLMMFYGNVGSVEFISVGLAALLFYTFPPIVALIHVVVLGERVAPLRLLAIGIAFAGLAVMLGASLRDSSALGMSLALGAGISAAWHTVWIVRRLSHHDPLVLTWHMSSVATAVLLVVSLTAGALRAPSEPSGWLGLSLVVLLQASAIPLYFLAMLRVGALRSAMVSNVQPVMSIVAAFVLYGETIGSTQLLGGTLVIGAVVWMQRMDWRVRAAGRTR